MFDVADAPTFDVDTGTKGIEGGIVEVMEGGRVTKGEYQQTGVDENGRPIYEVVEIFRGYTLKVKYKVCQKGTKKYSASFTVTQYRSVIGIISMSTINTYASCDAAEYITPYEEYQRSDIVDFTNVENSYYSSIK